MSFVNLGLAPALVRALADQNYSAPTPIQAAAIPPALIGRDLLAAAQTGTGKTAAFALPMLQRLFIDSTARGVSRRPRALIVTPTRELALQVEASIRDYARYLKVSTMTVFGGVGMQPQTDALRRGVDVVVATPGRLLDHIARRGVDLDGIELLVLDEADRMLDMGFLPVIKRIIGLTPRSRQTLMFSATFPDEIKALAAQFLRDPQQVAVSTRNTAPVAITDRVHPVDSERKRELLTHLLAQDSRRQTLVFARTKHGSDKLVKQLVAEGFKAAAIHGNKSQGARVRALGDFKNGRVNILVATDIAARGLDIEQLPMVINYELPMVAEDYVHRIGRTGRAGASGVALSLVAQDESDRLRAIHKLLGREIERVEIEGFVPMRPIKLTGGGGEQRRVESPRGARPPARNNASPARHARRPHAHSTAREGSPQPRPTHQRPAGPRSDRDRGQRPQQPRAR
ncbi:MAG: DEAD/DEAH box helicase [Lysobacterales bacterium]